MSRARLPVLAVALATLATVPRASAQDTAPKVAAPRLAEAPSPPEEPKGLVASARPSSVCELTGQVDKEGLNEGLDLTTRDGRRLLYVRSGTATVSLGNDGTAFAEVRLPTSTVVRGFTSQKNGSDGSARGLVAVHARGGLSFGGVLFPGASKRMIVRGLHDGKVVVQPFDGTYAFTLAKDARQLEVSCADLSLGADAAAALERSEPPAPGSPRAAQTVWLSRKEPVPVSAEADGPVGGTFDVVEDGPTEVTLLERRGRRARVRYLDVAGWVDAAKISTSKPRRRRSAKKEAVQFGLIGLIDTSGGGAGDGSLDLSDGSFGARSIGEGDSSFGLSEREVPALAAALRAEQRRNAGVTRRLSCSGEVRLVAETRAKASAGSGGVATASRLVVGAIPAARPFRVIETGSDLAAVAYGRWLIFMSDDVRLAVPTRDLAVGCREVRIEGDDALTEAVHGGPR